MRASNNQEIARLAARAIEGQTARELQTVEAIELVLQIGVATARVAAAGAEAEIESEIEVYLQVRAVAGGVAAPSVVPPVARVAPVPAVHGVPQAWEVLVAGEVPVVAVVGDGGN